jgi:hypothetical protein
VTGLTGWRLTNVNQTGPTPTELIWAAKQGLLPQLSYNIGAIYRCSVKRLLKVTRAISSSSFTFSRTVHLPERVDGTNVKAQLEHGILTVEIPKATETPVTVVKVF